MPSCCAAWTKRGKTFFVVSASCVANWMRPTGGSWTGLVFCQLGTGTWFPPTATGSSDLATKQLIVAPPCCHVAGSALDCFGPSTASVQYNDDHRERNPDLKRFLRTRVIQTVASLHLDEVMLRRQRWRASRGDPLVLVVGMHETLQRDADQYRRQLEWVAKHFTLISPETFFGLWDRTRTRPKWSKPAVLFTFD